MKLATMISSIRRTALEGVQVVLARLGLDVLGLADQEARGRVDALAVLGEQPDHRVLGQPVDLHIGVPDPQLVGDGQVAAGVPEPDGRRDEQRAAAAPAPAGPGGPARPMGQRLDEVVDQQVGLDRLAHRRGVPGTADRDQGAAGPLGQRDPGLVGDDRVLVAVQDQDRAADLPADRLGIRGGRLGEPRHGLQQGLRVGVQAPADPVLPGLGRVRLGEHMGHEELDPAAVVGQPVVPVDLLPALVARPRLVEVARYRPGQRRPDGDHPGGPLRVPRRELQRVPPAQ
jgi:hypothetical protein